MNGVLLGLVAVLCLTRPVLAQTAQVGDAAREFYL
jgi:hypothetical protein